MIITHTNTYVSMVYSLQKATILAVTGKAALRENYKLPENMSLRFISVKNMPVKPAGYGTHRVKLSH